MGMLLVVLGLVIPEHFKMPVIGASGKSYHQKSFWYYPWGKSGTHKGVDIFAKAGTPIVSSTEGLVIYTGQNKLGGRVVLVLGPKWRLHYYAHLNQIKTTFLSFVGHQDTIGTVGTSGNAKGKSPHLHYAISTLIPYVWKADGSQQGWKKMWYLNPVEKLNDITTQEAH
jgi:murein DD-endopeptidase MepM/ murein hydrolase activator NlpD